MSARSVLLATLLGLGVLAAASASVLLLRGSDPAVVRGVVLGAGLGAAGIAVEAVLLVRALALPHGPALRVVTAGFLVRLTVLACGYLWAGDDGDPGRGAHPVLLGCILLVEAGAVATFTARDLVVFFVAFEVVLVPMWFVVARFGDDASIPTPAVLAVRPDAPRGPAARSDAASRFVLFTALGSAVMLLGIVLLFLNIKKILRLA